MDQFRKQQRNMHQKTFQLILLRSPVVPLQFPTLQCLNIFFNYVLYFVIKSQLSQQLLPFLHTLRCKYFPLYTGKQQDYARNKQALHYHLIWRVLFNSGRRMQRLENADISSFVCRCWNPFVNQTTKHVSSEYLLRKSINAHHKQALKVLGTNPFRVCWLVSRSFSAWVTHCR